MAERDDSTLIVTLTVGHLRELVRSEVEAALAEHAQRPALLGRVELARTLGVSAASIDRLRAQGMPCLKLGDCPRFVLADVLDWLHLRSQPKTLSLLKGGAR